MYKILFNKWNTIALLLLVITFSFGTYWIRQKVQQQSNDVSQSIIRGSTRGYQKFLNHYFDNYSHVLQQLDYVWQTQKKGETDIQDRLNVLLNGDSTIVAFAVIDNKQWWKIQKDSSLLPFDEMEKLLRSFNPDIQTTCVLQERYLFIGGTKSENNIYCSGLLIDLHQMHQKFIWDNIYTSVYQVIINQNQQCIYHPEIEMVGKHYTLPAFLFTRESDQHTPFDTLHITQSTYLQFPVYKKYSPMLYKGDQWLVLSVSPGFEVQDIIAEQELNMLLLFILFIITLLGILIFGIVHWKREFLLRSSAEQETLNLMLKHEKQKSDTISIKLELLRSGLNSHFMFNSLGTVKALLSKDDKIARGMLSNLSHLYRYQLRIEGEQMVTLQEELTFTQTYVDVINLRMSSSIQMNITNLPDYLENKVLPISLQLLVENCIKHNIASLNHPLLITIEVKEGRIFVINDLRPKVAIVETNGKGLKNLNTRYSLITQMECTFEQESGQFIATIPLIK